MHRPEIIMSAEYRACKSSVPNRYNHYNNTVSKAKTNRSLVCIYDNRGAITHAYYLLNYTIAPALYVYCIMYILRSVIEYTTNWLLKNKPITRYGFLVIINLIYRVLLMIVSSSTQDVRWIL